MPNRTLRVGAGKAPIRFPSGYFPQENCSGEHDPIHARALLLEYEEQVLIVSLELPSLRPFSLIDQVKKLVSTETGIPESGIWICMTHNLSTVHVPNPETESGQFHAHMAAVCYAVLDACRHAVGTIREARLRVGTGSSHVNSNRDILTKDGWWLGVGGGGPTDELLTVLRFDDVEGSPIALLYHYAVKSSVLEGAAMKDGMRLSTSDLTGRACQIAEEEFGAPVLFFMGAAADQVPRKKAMYWKTDADGNRTEVNLGEQGFACLAELGAELGRDVIAAASTAILEPLASMQYITLRWMFPGQQFYTGPRPYQPTKPEEYEYMPGPDQALEIALLCIGSVALFGMQPETTAVVGMQLREAVQGWKPLVVAMVNGGKDYLADVSAYDRCTFAGTHSVFARGSAEQFVARAARLLHQLPAQAGE